MTAQTAQDAPGAAEQSHVCPYRDALERLRAASEACVWTPEQPFAAAFAAVDALPREVERAIATLDEESPE